MRPALTQSSARLGLVTALAGCIAASCGFDPGRPRGGVESEGDGTSVEADPSRAGSSSGQETGAQALRSTGNETTSGQGGSSGLPAEADRAEASTGESIPTPAFEQVSLSIPHALLYGVYGPGQAWGDLDGDGWLDLVTVGGAEPCRVWKNDGGSLQASALSEQLVPYLHTAGVTMPDYDNDGDPDPYLLRMGKSVLLRNDEGETFVDVSAAAGVDYDGHPSAATWGDYDGDGNLDLYLATLGTETDVLYHNEGDGTFTDRTDLLPVPGMLGHQTFAASFSDFDDDGDVDLYVVDDKLVGNTMWRNDGPGCGGWCFADVSAQWGVDAEVFGMGLAVGDVDNDLDLDLSFSDVSAHHLYRREGPDHAPEYNDIATQAGVTFAAHGWGTLFLDYDNDGWLDLYVADSILPGPNSRMFRNRGDGSTFEDVSADCGCVDPGWAFGVSSADYDVDGRVDLVVGHRAIGHRLYHNESDTGHHWLEIELRGAGPVNRDAVGAKVYVVTTDGDILRRDVELGSGPASQNSRRLHFGLGTAAPAAIEIRWPDGTVEEPPTPPADALWIHAYPGAVSPRVSSAVDPRQGDLGVPSGRVVTAP